MIGPLKRAVGPFIFFNNSLVAVHNEKIILLRITPGIITCYGVFTLVGAVRMNLMSFSLGRRTKIRADLSHRIGFIV